jgi:RNA polymerase sigma-70 factor (ECF subfamily)
MSVAETEHPVPGNKPEAEARLDPAAFVRLYRVHYDAIFRYCVHRLFARHAAEDMTAEIFLKVAQNLHRLHSLDERQFLAWLYRVATNEINAHLRKARRREGLFRSFRERPHHAVADPVLPADERLALLREAVLALKPRYQAVITLRYFEDLNATEIAEVLGCSPGTARSQLARATAQLRRKLAPACGVID